MVANQSYFYSIFFTAGAILHADREYVITPLAVKVIYAGIVSFLGDHVKQASNWCKEQADYKYLQAFILSFNANKSKEEGYH